MTFPAHVEKIVTDGTKLFSERAAVMGFWQDVAQNFYPEVADFTLRPSINYDFTEHLTTSYPILARRSLGDALSALLRPVQLDTTSPGVWYSIQPTISIAKDLESQRWLETATKVMRRHMYSRQSQFVRATKEGDHFFVTFGQCVISVQLNRTRTNLLYRSHHLRDVAWADGPEGEINHIQLKWEPTATQLYEYFGNKVSPVVKSKVKDSPYEKIQCRNIVIKTSLWETKGGRHYSMPWVSLWIDEANQTVLEETPSRNRKYIIPRWATMPGAQYAISPAVTAGLPDAKLLQAMMLSTLEAGEKFANPPLVASEEAIRTDVNLMAGGTTWVDSAYDGKLDQAIRPLYEPSAGQGLNTALQIGGKIEQTLSKAFFLDSLSLPPATVAKEMTAFEVGQRISEWIRRAMPIFEPIEYDYNATLCEETFDLLMHNGGFGPLAQVPKALRNTEIEFKFESPIHQGADRQKAQRLLEAISLVAQVAQLDPSARHMLNARSSLRGALTAIGVSPADQLDDNEMEEMAKAEQQRMQAQAMLAGAGQAADVAAKLGSAAKGFAAAQPQAQ